MKIVTTLFDIALLPIAIAEDIVLAPVKLMDDHDCGKSETRKQVEKIDKDLSE